jgi:hypothetical protein
MDPTVEDKEHWPPVAEGSAPPLSLAELEQAVRHADPTALLVLPRILRRVIKEDCRLTGFAMRVPHRKSYGIDHQSLLQIVDKAELGLGADEELPETVILLARPDPRKLAALSTAELLIRCWRLLLHARVHLALQRQIDQGRLTAAVVRRRIHQLGPTEFEEIRSVLRQEGFLLPPRSEESTYLEFAAVYLELRYFAPSFLPRFFPALENLKSVDEVLAQDLDAESLFRATRPAGAPAPEDYSGLEELVQRPAGGELRDWGPAAGSAEPCERKYRAWLRRAQRPASLGNVVGAAIYRARAQRYAPPEMAERARIAVRTDLHHLIQRLQAALEIHDRGPQFWHESLWALLMQTPRGIWTPEARLLYDLQKVCVDYERDIYTVDLMEWALSWGKRPIKRPLPNERDVLMCKHLRSALRRLTVVRLSDGQRQQLSVLLRGAIERVEERVRNRFRPLITQGLDEVQLTPRNLPESVARKKLVEELLDRIVEHGFFYMGHFRDALSRNQLKLPDVTHPRDLFPGDQLLRADRRLAVSLDGVYHRAEIYLRWMQRFTALGFGTGFGRLLTRFGVVPFGGAYLILAFIYHQTEEICDVELPIYNLPAVFSLGLFLLALVHLRWFRRGVWQFFRASFRLARGLVVDLPLRVIRLPWVQRFLRSRPAVLGFRFVLKPLVLTAAAWQLIPARQSRPPTTLGTAVSLFLAMNLLLNSRLGRNVQEVLADWLVQGWQRYGIRLLSGLFYLVIDIFKGFLASVERLLYTVDEWLRFRSGQSDMLLVAKAGLGLIWFWVAYVTRFAINLLIEPQINPIKHFPVVTVSHKLLFPFYYSFAELLAVGLNIDLPLAGALATGIIWCIPGIFGFLVWELRGNWRLYAANRPDRLKPVGIGPHGESMVRLLKPGFHSGTIPKRYAKLRRAERKARAKGNWSAARKHQEALRRVELAIRRYVEREMLPLLEESRCWQAPPVSVEKIHLGSNCVRIALRCEGLAQCGLRIAFESRAGWLVAGVLSAGWSEDLLPHQRQVLTSALVGLYKSGAAELVRQQIESALPPPPAPYDLTEEGLVVWPDAAWEAAVLYKLRDSAAVAPHVILGTLRRLMPTVERSRLIFREVPVFWPRWVEVWEDDRAGRGHPGNGIVPVAILPTGTSPTISGSG